VVMQTVKAIAEANKATFFMIFPESRSCLV
jgi:hypothetical protein